MNDGLLVYEFASSNKRREERVRRGVDDLKIVHRWVLRRMARLGMPADLQYGFRVEVGEPSDYFIRDKVAIRVTVTLPPVPL